MDLIMTNIMTAVSINNKEILEVLNSFKDLWYSDLDTFKENAHIHFNEKDRQDYISDEYCKKIMSKSKGHDGFPEVVKSYDLKNQKSIEYSKKYFELNTKLQTLLATYNNALCTVYPPEGFISWHNNANASAYNLIFTWSETGDGYWKHIDPHTGEQVLVKDVLGWQCKAFFFGGYEDDPKDLVYHMASTDCWRMTISYIFDRHHKQFWQDIIEEIETP
jgi:hypothetical protein|tara:strand:+ start:25706 stop:26362 length:657 start_codon:yes stop_codon:yes gene_type:complete